MEENKSLIIFGFLALVVGFVGWFGYGYINKKFKTNQDSKADLNLEISDEKREEVAERLPTIEESKLEEFTEEEKKEIEDQRIAVEAKSVDGFIKELSEESLLLSSIDETQTWTIIITENTRFDNLVVEEDEDTGDFSDMEEGMDVKVYASEQLGTKTKIKAEKILYRK